MRYEIPGNACATVITKPGVVAALLKRAKNPLIVVAHAMDLPTRDTGNPTDLIIDISRSTGTPVIVTPSGLPSFRKRGFSPAKVLSLMETGARLNDPGWSVTNGSGGHDLVLFIGISYGTGWLLQSGLKSFAPEGMRFISIDRHYQPHCNLSFPNLTVDTWIEQLEEIAREVRQG